MNFAIEGNRFASDAKSEAIQGLSFGGQKYQDYGALGQAPPVRQCLTDMLQMQQKLIAELVTSISQLEQRLSGVLIPSPPSAMANTAEGPRETASPVADGLRQNNAVLSGLTSHIVAITSRVDI